MPIIVNRNLINQENGAMLEKLCPFGAITYNEGTLSIGMACKLCKLCVKKSEGAITYEEEEIREKVDKSEWKGITVFAEHSGGKIHNVTLEIIGKARELATVTGHEVQVLLIGYGIQYAAEELIRYGADKVYVYDDKGLENFLVEPYTNVFEDYIRKIRPSSVLVGATNTGRSLAPRIASRLKTGLTADCTMLEMKENTDLVQIRPAFGGNIMARILTPNTRPQFCTVRYKIFPMPVKIERYGEVITMTVSQTLLESRAEIISIEKKPVAPDISEADVIIQVGRGVRSKDDLKMIQKLADLLGARMACTRPLVENGWFDAKSQIGLSGRTVKPRLLVTIGVSGAVQTVAGMKGSETIVAINSDSGAPIFDTAHYGFVGDLYEIVPGLIEMLEKEVK